MRFTLYNPETGYLQDYEIDRKEKIIFGRKNLEKSFIERKINPSGLEYVSRKHFSIRIFGNQYVLTDLSKNRVCVNGRRVQSAFELKSGDIIRIGPNDREDAVLFYFLTNKEVL